MSNVKRCLSALESDGFQPVVQHDHKQCKAVSIDGGTVTIRGQGGREVKVGAVFDVETRLERNPQTQKLEDGGQPALHSRSGVKARVHACNVGIGG
jgi:hypothetical protein